MTISANLIGQLSKSRYKVLQENSDLLSDVLRGVEKESLRVTPEGQLSQQAHPETLGSALTHSSITTDYSEALLEFITEPHSSVEALFGQLDDIHRYCYSQIGDERLWVTSMPCMLGKDDDIPVARYGRSNVGQMKTIYRLGLGHRYGRAMQTIAGVHYNFSLPDSLWQALKEAEGSELELCDYKTQGYFALIRNFRRCYWLLILLFGAAPAVCRSFVKGRNHNLEAVGDDDHSLHTPNATSLRMGDLGYQSNAQQSLSVCYNQLDNYMNTLVEAISANHPEYDAIGLKDEQGQHKQLNTSLLQIENEFYSPIRPKRPANTGETALTALKRGVEYIEVRCIDLNPFEPLGISEEHIRFIDSFLLFCLLNESPDSDINEHQRITENQTRVVYQGRDPKLCLQTSSGDVNAHDWAQTLLAEINKAAQLLDCNRTDNANQNSIASQSEKLAGTKAFPAQAILEQMQKNQQTFYRFAEQQAIAHKDYFLSRPLGEAKMQEFKQNACDSLALQKALEQADTGSFENYLADYYRQYE